MPVPSAFKRPDNTDFKPEAWQGSIPPAASFDFDLMMSNAVTAYRDKKKTVQDQVKWGEQEKKDIQEPLTTKLKGLLGISSSAGPALSGRSQQVTPENIQRAIDFLEACRRGTQQGAEQALNKMIAKASKVEAFKAQNAGFLTSIINNLITQKQHAEAYHAKIAAQQAFYAAETARVAALKAFREKVTTLEAKRDNEQFISEMEAAFPELKALVSADIQQLQTELSQWQQATNQAIGDERAAIKAAIATATSQTAKDVRMVPPRSPEAISNWEAQDKDLTVNRLQEAYFNAKKAVALQGEITTFKSTHQTTLAAHAKILGALVYLKQRRDQPPVQANPSYDTAIAGGLLQSVDYQALQDTINAAVKLQQSLDAATNERFANKVKEDNKDLLETVRAITTAETYLINQRPASEMPANAVADGSRQDRPDAAAAENISEGLRAIFEPVIEDDRMTRSNESEKAKRRADYLPEVKPTGTDDEIAAAMKQADERLIDDFAKLVGLRRFTNEQRTYLLERLEYVWRPETGQLNTPLPEHPNNKKGNAIRKAMVDALNCQEVKDFQAEPSGQNEVSQFTVVQDDDSRSQEQKKAAELYHKFRSAVDVSRSSGHHDESTTGARLFANIQSDGKLEVRDSCKEKKSLLFYVFEKGPNAKGDITGKSLTTMAECTAAVERSPLQMSSDRLNDAQVAYLVDKLMRYKNSETEYGKATAILDAIGAGSVKSNGQPADYDLDKLRAAISQHTGWHFPFTRTRGEVIWDEAKAAADKASKASGPRQ